MNRAALEESLRRLLQLPVDRIDTAGLLSEAVGIAARLFRVSGVGLLVIDPDQVLRYVAASDEPGRALEHAQEKAGVGPCVDAFIHGTPVHTTDVTVDKRWPQLWPLLEPTAVRAVLGVPIQLSGSPVGSINIYLNRPHEWDAGEHAALVAYGNVVEQLLAASIALHRSGQLAEQLQYALEYRVIIERGIGYLMARDGLDEVAAFNQLRSAARRSRRKIGDVAREVLAGRSTG